MDSSPVIANSSRFDITIQTKQRKAFTSPESFFYHAWIVEPELSIQSPIPSFDIDVAVKRPYRKLFPSDSMDKDLHITLTKLIKDFQNLFSKFSSQLERIERVGGGWYFGFSAQGVYTP